LNKQNLAQEIETLDSAGFYGFHDGLNKQNLAQEIETVEWCEDAEKSG